MRIFHRRSRRIARPWGRNHTLIGRCDLEVIIPGAPRLLTRRIRIPGARLFLAAPAIPVTYVLAVIAAIALFILLPGHDVFTAAGALMGCIISAHLLATALQARWRARHGLDAQIPLSVYLNADRTPDQLLDLVRDLDTASTLYEDGDLDEYAHKQLVASVIRAITTSRAPSAPLNLGAAREHLAQALNKPQAAVGAVRHDEPHTERR